MFIQEGPGVISDERKKDEELDRQVMLAEQRREEERILQEERQREKLEKIKAVEGNWRPRLCPIFFPNHSIARSSFSSAV